MTEQPGESNVGPRRRRRWRSSQQAYEEGVVAGFTAAVEVVRMLNDPKAFIARVEALEREFGNSLKALLDKSNVE